MWLRKQSKHIIGFLGFLIVLLAPGAVLLAGNPAAFAANSEPGRFAPAGSSIRITNQAGVTIDSLTLNVDVNDPLFPISQAVTINLSSTSAHNILITEVHYFDQFHNELTVGNPDLTLRPGVSLTPNPVGQRLPLTGTPVPVRLTPTGVVVRTGLTVFPISGGEIEFVGEDQSTITTTTRKSLGVNISTLLADFTVPTLSEWGRIIMFLLLSATGLSFVLLKHHKAVVVAGPIQTEIAGVQLGRAFDLRTFGKVLANISALIIVGALLAYAAFGGIGAIDILGSLTCGVIIAFVVHLFIINRTQATISAANRRKNG